MSFRAFVWTASSRSLPIACVASLSVALGWSSPAAQVTTVNDPLVTGGNAGPWVHSPDGRRVIYLADQDTLGTKEVYDVPIDGSQPSRPLSAPLLPGRTVQRFLVTRDGSRVVYVADQDTDEQFELYSVPTDGSRVATKLNGPMIPQGDVDHGVALSPDGARVLFRANDVQANSWHSFTVPTDGSDAPVDVGGELFQFTSDSSRLLVFDAYRFSVMPAAGGARQLIVDTEGIGTWKLSPDDAHIVYYARYLDASHHLARGFFSVQVEGGEPPLMLIGPLADADITNPRLAFTPDSQRIIAVYDPVQQLYSMRVDGEGPIALLSDLPNATVNEFRLGNHGRDVVFSATNGAFTPGNLYRASADGSSGPELLTGTFTGFLGAFELTTVDRVVFLGLETDAWRVYSVRLESGDVPIELSGPMVAGGSAWSLSVDPTGTWVFYRADQDVEDQIELYAAPIDGRLPAVKVSGSMAPEGDVFVTVTFAPGSRRVVFQANANGPYELFTNHYVIPPTPQTGTHAPGTGGTLAPISVSAP